MHRIRRGSRAQAHCHFSVKLLFDQNLSFHLVAVLHGLYPGSVHVRDVQLGSADDAEVWSYATKQAVPSSPRTTTFSSAVSSLALLRKLSGYSLETAEPGISQDSYARDTVTSRFSCMTRKLRFSFFVLHPNTGITPSFRPTEFGSGLRAVGWCQVSGGWS